MNCVRALRTAHVIIPACPFRHPQPLHRLHLRPSLIHPTEPHLARRSHHSMSSPAKVRPGACLCGIVQYEATGEPFHYVLCHCSNCKKSAGSAFMAHSYWKPDQLKITEGATSIRHYSDNNTKSGNTITRSFCINCGSSLFVKPSKSDFIIAQPSAIEGHQAWAPKKEVYADSRAQWLKDITFVAKKSKLQFSLPP